MKNTEKDIDLWGIQPSRSIHLLISHKSNFIFLLYCHQLTASEPPGESQWNKPAVVRSSELEIAFLLGCCDLLYFIKNEWGLGIKCSAWSGFIQCTLQFFSPVSTSLRSQGIWWQVHWTVPPLRPPFHWGCTVHLCRCYLFCLDLSS